MGVLLILLYGITNILISRSRLLLQFEDTKEIRNVINSITFIGIGMLSLFH